MTAAALTLSDAATFEICSIGIHITLQPEVVALIREFRELDAKALRALEKHDGAFAAKLNAEKWELAKRLPRALDTVVLP